MGKKKRKKSKQKKEVEAVEEAEDVEAVEGPTISLQDLNNIAMTMMSSGLAIDRLEPEDAREQLMRESWDLCQLLIKQNIRACRKNVNDQLVQFFTQFPEALEPINEQFNPPTADEEE